MDSARVTNDLLIVSRRIALIGSLVSRLIAFCLLYFAPTLAYEQGSPAPDLIPAVDASAVSESLDPKHEKDHDRDRGGDRGHALRLRNP